MMNSASLMLLALLMCAGCMTTNNANSNVASSDGREMSPAKDEELAEREYEAARHARFYEAMKIQQAAAKIRRQPNKFLLTI